MAELECYSVGEAGFLVHNGCPHTAWWELEGPDGKVLAKGVEESGYDFALNEGEQPTFPQQAEWGHTEGKVIADLEEKGLLAPGRRLIFDGENPPCPNCQKIMQEASGNYQMEILYRDGSFNQWAWKNGVRM